MRRAAAKRGEERAAAEEKTGVFTGFFATNPVNEARIPIWVADYVLMDYGTGAIMAVPAHDERDREFAETFDLPIVPVIDEDGKLDRLGAVHRPAGRGGEARDRRLARRARPRQAGDQLPSARLGLLAPALLGLPDPDRLLRRRAARSPSRRGAAGRAARHRGLPAEGHRAARVGRGLGARAVPACAARRGGARSRRWTPSSTRRGTSCASAIRTTTTRRGDSELVDWWNPVDQYIGGVDHATMHLIYARFFMKALNDLGLVGFREPFQHLFTNGWVQLGGTKMSKSKGNVIGPERDDRGVRRRRHAALHPLHRARRRGHGVDRRRRRGDGALRPPPLPARRRGRRARRRTASRRRTSCRARRTRRSRR